MFNTNRKFILIIILILGVFIMPKFINDIVKYANEQIKYKNTITTGEITAVNSNGTYDVKIGNAPNAFPDVETNSYDSLFLVGQKVIIGFKNGCREDPIIMGQSKEIKQEPAKVEVDYSGGCAGIQTKTVTIYSSANDGIVYNRNANYVNCYDANAGTVNDTDSLLTVGYNYYDDIDLGWIYSIYRSFLFFDTSIIPTNAIITAATLYLRESGEGGLEGNGFNVVIQNGQPNYPHSPLIVGDYNKGNYFNNGGQVNAGNIGNSYTGIILNSNGKAWINKGGLTKLCLRSSKEIAGMDSSAGDIYYEQISISSYEEGEGFKPKLTITYTI